MKRIRLGNTVDIVWEIFLGKDKDKGKYDLTGKKLTIYLVSAFEIIKISDFTTEFNVLRFTFEGKDQKHAGRYQLTFVENEGSDDTRTLNLCDAFELVRESCKETDDLSEITLTSSFDALRIYPIVPQVGPNRNWWVDGVDTGKSSVGLTAYEFAKEQGYEGTEEEYAAECLAVPVLNEESREATEAATKAAEAATNAAMTATDAAESASNASAEASTNASQAAVATASANEAAEKANEAAGKAEETIGAFGSAIANKADKIKFDGKSYVETDGISTNDFYYCMPDSADGTEDDIIATKSNLKKINGQDLYGRGNIVIEGGEGSYDDTEIKAKLTELSEKVNDIADLEKTSEEDDVIVIEDNDGNKIVEINAEGADFKNLKSNGKPVATEQVEETESSAEEQVWMADDESEEYAKINKEGVHGKAFFFKAKNGENVNLAKVADNVSIHLSNIYGFVGDTIQVFFHSIIENYENYVIKVSCKYGKIYPKYYECTPSVECDEPLIMSVYTNNGVLLASKEVRLVVTSAKNVTSAKRILIIGDSTIQNGEVAIEMSRRMKGTSGVASSPSPMALSNYAITGRIKNADGSVGWEGIGGWRWDDYLGSTGNPGARLYINGVTDINVGDRFRLEGYTQEFLISEKNITNGVGYVYATFYGQGDIYKNHSLMPTDGTMTKVVGSGVTSFAFSNARIESYQPLWNTDTNQWDILGYCNEHCGGAVHCICTQLGINSLGRDAFGSYADIADKVRLFLDRTHSQMPDCIVLLGKIMLPSQMGGLGKDYTTNDQFGNYNAEGFNVKIHQYNAILESIANEEKYSSFVKVVDLCSQFDAVNNYPTFEKQVNTRNPQKEVLGGNGVHPNNYGYWQVADAWVRTIVNVIK